MEKLVAELSARFEHSCLFNDFLSYKKNLEGGKIDDSTTYIYVKYKIFFVKVLFLEYGKYKYKFNILGKDNYGRCKVRSASWFYPGRENGTKKRTGLIRCH